jgi:hypothetical protein
MSPFINRAFTARKSENRPHPQISRGSGAQRLACPSDEMAAALHDHVLRAVESSRARRRVWQVPAGEGAKAKQHRRTQSAPSRKAIVDKSAGASSADAGVPWQGAAAICTSHAFGRRPRRRPGRELGPSSRPQETVLGSKGEGQVDPSEIVHNNVVVKSRQCSLDVQ